MEDQKQTISMRKHAVIMFTGIAGYSRLMGTDEALAINIRTRNREIHENLVKKFNGSIIKDTADGMLINFKKGSDAVHCAREIQNHCKRSGVPLKIGIHAGETVFKDSDVLGDSVNVASRLEQSAKEGQILVSEIICNDIVGTSDIPTAHVGEKKFKNVEKPVNVYEVFSEGDIAGRLPWLEKKKISKPSTGYYALAGLVVVILSILFIWKFEPFSKQQNLVKSIAVRPFLNASTDTTNAYFVNGMTEEIRNKLARISDLRIISRGSMEKYRETELSNVEIASALNVNYILEGTVQKLGGLVKIHTQLVPSETDENLWEETYEREISDVNEIYNLQNQIAETISKELKAIITPQEKIFIEEVLTDNPEAYDLYLRAKDYHLIGDSVSLSIAIHLYNQAIDLDPDFAQAYTWLGMAYYDQIGCINCPTNVLKYYADTALFINPDLSDGYWLRAIHYFQKSEFDSSITEAIKAIELNPNNALALKTLGLNYYLKKDYFNGLIYLEKARKLLIGDLANYKDILDAYATIYMAYGHFVKTDSIFKASLDYDPQFGYSGPFLINFLKGNLGQAKIYLDSLCAINLGPGCTYFQNFYYSMTGDFEKFNEKVFNRSRLDFLDINWKGYVLFNLGRKDEAIKSCREATIILEEKIQQNKVSSTSGPDMYELAVQYVLLDDREKAYQLLYEAEENRNIEGWQVWIMPHDPRMKNIQKEEEYQNIIRRLEEHYNKIMAELDNIEQAGML